MSLAKDLKVRMVSLLLAHTRVDVLNKYPKIPSFLGVSWGTYLGRGLRIKLLGESRKGLLEGETIAEE